MAKNIERLCAGLLAGIMVWAPAPEHAEACSYIEQPEPVRPAPNVWDSGDDGATFPANGIFRGYAYGGGVDAWILDGEELEFEEMDVELGGTPQAGSYWLPTVDLTPGMVLENEYCNGEASCRVTVVEADYAAPEKPVLSNPLFTLERERIISRALPCGSAPNTFEFDLDVTDEGSASNQDLVILAYFGRSAQLATSAETAQMAFMMSSWAEPAERITAYVWEGNTEGFTTSVEFCFAVEVMDLAGNVSPRSEPMCVNPTDRRAPYVTGSGAGGCSVGASGSSSSSPWSLALLGFVLLGARRKTRRES